MASDPGSPKREQLRKKVVWLGEKVVWLFKRLTWQRLKQGDREMTLGVWLRTKAPTSPHADKIQAFAGSLKASEWPYNSEKLSDYRNVIEQRAPEAERRELIETLEECFEEWLRSSKIHKVGFWQKMSDKVAHSPGGLLLSAFGLIVAVLLVMGIFDVAFLTTMADARHARGLITFLFAFSAIAIIILIAIAVFWVDTGELRERFTYAKDIVTIIIGVLGTILGFYFGSLTNEGRPMPPANPDQTQDGGANPAEQPPAQN